MLTPTVGRQQPSPTNADYIFINFFIWPSAAGRNTAMEDFAKDGYNVSLWDREGFAFWAVSDVNAEDLRAFADLEMQQS